VPDSVRFAAKTPMKRNGQAEDVAAAVLFFATARSLSPGRSWPSTGAGL